MALPFAAVCHTRNQVSNRDGGTKPESKGCKPCHMH